MLNGYSTHLYQGQNCMVNKCQCCLVPRHSNVEKTNVFLSFVWGIQLVKEIKKFGDKNVIK